MIYLNFKVKIALLLFFISGSLLMSCNKGVQQFTDPATAPSTGLALGETIAATPTDSLYYKLILKSGMLVTINNTAANYTMFVPDNNGMKIFVNAISGGAVPLTAPDSVFAGFITANIPAASAAGIVSYNIIEL